MLELLDLDHELLVLCLEDRHLLRFLRGLVHRRLDELVLQIIDFVSPLIRDATEVLALVLNSGLELIDPHLVLLDLVLEFCRVACMLLLLGLHPVQGFLLHLYYLLLEALDLLVSVLHPPLKRLDRDLVLSQLLLKSLNLLVFFLKCDPLVIVVVCELSRLLVDLIL